MTSLLMLALVLSISAVAGGGQEVVVEALTKTSQSWDGSELPSYPKGIPEITILKFTIAPGVTLPLHKHLVINAGILTKGQMTVKSESGEVLNLSAGDTIVELIEKWHSGTNNGTEPAEIIVFYAGIKGQALTVKKP